MNKKKIVAMTMTTAMVLGQSISAFASEATTLPSGEQSAIESTGKLEGYVVNNVTRVVLPTASTTTFTLDPQGLLGIADNTKYTAGEGAVYFANAGTPAVNYAVGDTVYIADGSDTSAAITTGTLGTDFFATSDTGHTLAHTLTADDTGVVGTVKTPAGAATYSNTSDELVVVNKSSYAVDVTVKVAIAEATANAALEDISLVAQENLASATTPSLYLGIDLNGTTTAMTSATQTVSDTADAVPMKAAAVKYAVGDKVYIADGGDATAAITTGTLGTDFFATSDTGHTLERTLTADDTAVVNTAVKTPAVSNGYELKSSTNSSDAPAGTTVSPNGYYYFYALDNGYTSQPGEKVAFKLTGATNNVEGWKDVTEQVKATVTYTITEHTDTPPAPPAPSYTDVDITSNCSWVGDLLWLSPDGTNGFAESDLTVEYSADGTSYAAIAFEQNGDNWVSVSWTNLSAASAPIEGYKIRVTDGTTRYTYTR